MNKKTLIHLFSSLLCFTLAPNFCHALPKDPKVATGSVKIEHLDTKTMEIRTSDQSIINYSKFDIGKKEKVKFIQDSASSCVLNRVHSQDPSQILGSLESNGKVFLVNPNGIYFGPDSKVNVGSLIASTLNIEDGDFLKGSYNFTLNKDKLSSIRNEGSLIAHEGSVVLMAPQIHNAGLIEAKAGSVLLASGEHITLDFMGDGLLQFSVEGSLKEALIEHLGEIKGSTVSMKLPVAKKAISEIVNMDGAELGEIFIEENGVIKLASSSNITSNKMFLEGANLEIDGSIDTVSAISKGGDVHLFGTNITLKEAKIDASGALGGGEVLIGGEYQGGGSTPYASKVIMDRTSQISSNTLEKGDGGLVVLWSRDQTIFEGKISSNGGPLEGNGGMVETSSKYDLRSSGFVEAKAPEGKVGTWLLDPDYLTLIGGNQLCYPGCQNSDSGTHCHCGNVATADVSCDNPNSVSMCCDYSCGLDIVYQATYAIYVQSGIGQHGGTMNFKPCTGTYASPDGILPIYFQEGSSITTNCNTVQFYPGAIPVIDLAELVVNVTRDCSSDDGVVIMNDIQATQSNYGIVFTIGAKQTSQISTLHGAGLQRLNSTTNIPTYPPKYLTITNNANPPDPAYKVQTYGLTTSGGDIQINYTPLVLLDDAFLDTSNDDRFSGGTLSTGTIDAGNAGVQGVTINVGSSGCIAIDDIGVTSPLSNVAITGGSCGSLGGSDLTYSINTRNGSISIDGKILVSTDVILNTNSGGSGGNVTISPSAVFGGMSQVLTQLTVAAGSIGVVSLGNIGTVSPFTIVRVSSGESVTFNQVIAIEEISINSPIRLDSSGTLRLTGGDSSSAFITLTTVDGNSTNSFPITIDAGTAGLLTVGNMGLTTAPLGAVTISSGPNFHVPNILTNNSPIVINPTSLLTANTTLQTNYNGGIGGSITLSSVNGASAFTLDLLAGSGAVSVGALGPTLGAITIGGGALTLRGSVTTTAAGANLTLNNSGILSIQGGNISLSSGSFQQTGAGTTNLSKNITATSLAFTGPVTLTGPSTLTATSGTFSALSSISGGQNLTVDAVGNISTSSISVGDLILDSSSSFISVGGSLTATNATLIAGTDITINEVQNITNILTITASTGSILVTESLTAGTANLTASAGSLSIGDDLTVVNTTVNVGTDVTVEGSSFFSTSGSITTTSGDVSLQSVTSNGIFTVDAQGGSISTGSVLVSTATLTSFNDITIQGSFTATSNATLTADNGFISISGTLSGLNATFQAQTGVTIATVDSISSLLTITATTGNVSITTDLIATTADLTASAGSISIGGNSTTTTADFEALSGSVSVGGDLESAALTINAGTGVSISGTTTLSATSSITTTGGNIALHAVTSTGSFTADSDAGFISMSSLSASNVTLSSFEYTSILGSLSSTNSANVSAGDYISIGGNLVAANASLLAGTDVTIGGAAIISNVLTITASAGSILIELGAEATTGTFTASSGITVNGLLNIDTATLDATGGDISLHRVLSSTSFDATASAGTFSSLQIDAGSATFDISGSIAIAGSVSLDSTLTIQRANGLLIVGRTVVPTVNLGNGFGPVSGAVVFRGQVTIDTLTTAAQSYSLAILNGGTIGSATTFSNTGGVFLESGTSGSLLFDGALTSIASPTTILGNIGTTLGDMTFNTLTILSGGSALTTEGYDIIVGGTTTLEGDTILSTIGGDITFSSTVEGSGGLTVSSAPLGVVTFGAPVGFVTPLSYFTALDTGSVSIQGVNAIGTIAISTPITLTGVWDNIFQSEGFITLGDTDGTLFGFQDLTILAGTGGVNLGNLGATVALDHVLIERGDRALIQNMNTAGSIEIDIDTVLATTRSGITTLNTTAASAAGDDVILNRIDANQLRVQGLVINAGTAGDVFLEKNIGTTIPIASLEVTAETLFFEGSKISITGNQKYHSPTIVEQTAVFTTFGNITFYSFLNTSSDTTSLLFYMGGGVFTVLGSIGNIAMGDLYVFNSGSFHSQQIRANSLRVSGGLSNITLNDSIDLAGPSGIILDGGPIHLGGEIDANHVFFRSSATMTNLDTPMPINVLGNSSIQFEYFNALGGNIGSPSSPIEINMINQSNLGAHSRADFIGSPFHDRFFLIQSNPPCIVTFNGITVLECTTQPTTQSIFNSLSKNLLYVPGIYSSWSWDSFSNPWYFEEMPYDLGSNSRDRTLFYLKPKVRKPKKVIVQ